MTGNIWLTVLFHLLGCDVSSAQTSGVHSIDNPLVLGEHSRGSAFAERVVGVLGSTFSPVARNQVSQWWWLELAVCVHSCSGKLQVPV